MVTMPATRPFFLPRLIGHRGAAALAPENTLAGFRAARGAGLAWVEFDVRLSADGRCILLHDDTLDRTTDGSGVAAEQTLAELDVWDAGAWFDASFAGERIPTLEEAIDLLATLGLAANIEIKPHPGQEYATGAAVASLLDAAWPDELPPPLLSSFAADSLAAARAVMPHLPRGFLTAGLEEGWRDGAASLGCSTVHCDHTRLTRAKAQPVIAAGYKLLAYTVNHAGRAEELWSWGVTGLFTDTPDRLREAASHADADYPSQGRPAPPI